MSARNHDLREPPPLHTFLKLSRYLTPIHTPYTGSFTGTVTPPTSAWMDHIWLGLINKSYEEYRRDNPCPSNGMGGGMGGGMEAQVCVVFVHCMCVWVYNVRCVM